MLPVALRMVFSPSFWRMAILWPLALLYNYLQLFLLCFCRRRQSYPRCCLGSKTSHPVCIITGASSGLGAASARAMAAEGFHVILAGRCTESLSKIIQGIKQQQEDARLSSLQVDMSSIYSIKKFEKSIRQCLLEANLHPSVQLLINNAGILATSFRATTDGYDQMMGTNYIGAFVLTHLLLPLLKNSPTPSRVVNVTSFTHRFVSCNVEIDKEALAGKALTCFSISSRYPFAYRYEYSKFCMLLFTYQLHRKLYRADASCNVSVMAADPGAVKTNIMRELPLCISNLAFTVLGAMNLLHTPETGVASIIDAALAPPEASGEYFFGGKGRTIESSRISYNAMLAERLWSNSLGFLRDAEISEAADD